MLGDYFTIFTACLLGVLQSSTFFGFDLLAFVAEPITHSVHVRCPDCIVEFAGYYGQSVVYFVYTLANLIVPCFLHKLGVRGNLLAGAFCFLLFCLSFFQLSNYTYFPACFAAGFGFAFYYCGAGVYSSKHSTEVTISRNQSLTWMCAAIGLSLCGVYILISSEITAMQMVALEQTNLTIIETTFRDYSDYEIRILAIGTVGVSCLAMTLAFTIPIRPIKDSLYEKTNHVNTIRDQLKMVMWAIRQKGLLKMAPFYLFTGFFTIFWLSIYTTAISFTESLAVYKNLAAYYCMAVMFGEVVVGVLMSYLNKRIKDFGLVPAMCMVISMYSLASVLIVLYTPAESSIRPTSELSLIEPSYWVALLIGVLLGVVDGAMNNVRITAAARAVPSQPAIAFCITKFYQALASTIFYYLCSILDAYQIVALMTFTLLAGLIGFISLLKDLRGVHDAEKLAERKIRI